MTGVNRYAGPFQETDVHPVPADKKLSKDWVDSLFARGSKTVYRKSGNELRYIGMPVGGLFCGTVYLGGDGKLWLWDILNENKEGILSKRIEWKDGTWAKSNTIGSRDGASYVEPNLQYSPFDQGFSIAVSGVTKQLRASDWKEVTFSGQYPIGEIEFTDPASPVKVKQTSYSPFIPLDVESSSLPLTVCEFEVENLTGKSIEVELKGWLQNAVCLNSRPSNRKRKSEAVSSAKFKGVFHSIDEPVVNQPTRPDQVLEDFEGDTYGNWEVTGTAFGSRPIKLSEVPGYQGNLRAKGSGVANTHASAPGQDIGAKDAQIGTLTSPEFTISRNYLAFLIGGGKNSVEVGLSLLIDGKRVRTASGRDNNAMSQAAFDVSEFENKKARIEIYDRAVGAWGNVGVDQIVLTDVDPSAKEVEKQPDFGSMSLIVLGGGESWVGEKKSTAATAPMNENLTGWATKKLTIPAHGRQTAVFAIAWHFPNSNLDVPGAEQGRHYAKKFKNAFAVAKSFADRHQELSSKTKLWRDCWYDSSLPFWFLDRTMANTSILATTTCHKFATGRFWAWEGIGCCAGTCTHVWHYAQAVGRLFPEIERNHRLGVDFGVGFDAASGTVRHRGEGTGPAIDGQAGRILGVYREHQMSSSDDFLKKIWPNVKKSLDFMIAKEDENHLLHGAQENTLDAAWFGEIAWISSLYAAALKAGSEMAKVVGDDAASQSLLGRFEKTKAAIESRLFNGEYFIQIPEPGREKSLGTYQSCHIDQVHGQSWAWQVGLGRVLDRDKTVSALRALYKYNFAPDVGPFRAKNREGRAYAIRGDGGLIMSTNPKGLPNPYGNVADWQYGYFNECMSGFEHQAASHMIAEGLTLEGLTVTRAINDRYSAKLRNPYNEIECSDHYSRAMASYGSYITLTGFELDGPRGHMGFVPRIAVSKCAFTAPAGWGHFTRDGKVCGIELLYGSLTLKTLRVKGGFSSVKVSGRKATVFSEGPTSLVTFEKPVILKAGQKLRIVLS